MELTKENSATPRNTAEALALLAANGVASWYISTRNRSGNPVQIYVVRSGSEYNLCATEHDHQTGTQISGGVYFIGTEEQVKVEILALDIHNGTSVWRRNSTSYFGQFSRAIGV